MEMLFVALFTLQTIFTGIIAVVALILLRVARLQEKTDEPPNSPPTRLAVTMPNGTMIKHKNAADTFIEVIKKLGRKRVKDLDLQVNGRNLMSTSEDDQQRRKLGGYYINVGTSTKRKSDLLEEIASKLGEPLKVEIIPKMR